MTDADLFVRRIRATRALPPKRAGQASERRALYGAALEQFEELLSAARTVGPATRPLQLFYSVEQAGAAIGAAFREDEKLPRSHGLGFRPAATFAESHVEQQPSGTFPAVAAATRSAGLPPGGCTAGQLWSSLPECSGVEFPASMSTLPRALLLQPDDNPYQRLVFRHTDKADAWLHRLPDELGDADDKEDFLRRYLSQYPSAKGWAPHPDGLALARYEDAGWSAHVQWTLDQSTGSARQRVDFLLGKVAPRYSSRDFGWLRPGLTTGQAPPSPLMTWWALLYALSMLARYNPARWVALLDVDASAEATLLETIMDDALVSIPRLVLATLLERPFIPDFSA